MIKFLEELVAVSSKKRQYFCHFFGENFLKIIASVPGLLVSGEPTFSSCRRGATLDRDLRDRETARWTSRRGREPAERKIEIQLKVC
jgi:hypothetical protein